jgi:hypothetical protein
VINLTTDQCHRSASFGKRAGNAAGNPRTPAGNKSHTTLQDVFSENFAAHVLPIQL